MSFPDSSETKNHLLLPHPHPLRLHLVEDPPCPFEGPSLCLEDPSLCLEGNVAFPKDFQCVLVIFLIIRQTTGTQLFLHICNIPLDSYNVRFYCCDFLFNIRYLLFNTQAFFARLMIRPSSSPAALFAFAFVVCFL